MKLTRQTAPAAPGANRRAGAVPMTEIEPGLNGERRAVAERGGLSVTARRLPADRG